MDRKYRIFKSALLTAFTVYLVIMPLGCRKQRDTKGENYTFRIINTYPHDANAFTQGLLFQDGFLYESTGIQGHSTLRKVELRSGKVVKQTRLDDIFFAEGVALVDDELFQVTWRSQTGFVYDVETFELVRTFSYTREAWGLTFDGQFLILSDGTNNLRFLETENFTIVRIVSVFDTAGPVERINELEYVKGQILANILGKKKIAVIEPESGRVTAWIDLRGLPLPKSKKVTIEVPKTTALSGRKNYYSPGVLNGIAYDRENDRLFVTGKLWPKLFEIKLVKE